MLRGSKAVPCSEVLSPQVSSLAVQQGHRGEHKGQCGLQTFNFLLWAACLEGFLYYNSIDEFGEEVLRGLLEP